MKLHRSITVYILFVFCLAATVLCWSGGAMSRNGHETRRNGGATGRVRISGDGSTVFCDTAGSGGLFLPNSSTPLPFGVHAFNAADGSYLRHVLTAEAIAQLFGLTPASLLYSDLDLNALSVSHDGSRLAYVVRAGGDHVALSVNFDGTGLVSLLGATLAEARQKFAGVGISGDGSKVAYHLTKLDGTDEIGVVAANGNQTTRKILLSVPFNTSSPLPTGLPTISGDQIELNTDGSKLLLGSTGVLADTVTDNPAARFLQLAIGHGTSEINRPLVYDGLNGATMNSSATRFLYVATDTNDVQQLATLDISANRGPAPGINEPKTDPTFLLTNARSEMTMSFRFNESTPCSTATGGRACAVGGSIAGTVSYCAANPAKPVPGVTINAAGSPTASATTDAGGNYQLPNLGGGSYTLTPAKTGDANGITSFDAAQIAQHVVGIITLNECQRAAADTSNNGEITSFDAAFIAQYVVGIANAANITGTWKFLPPTRTYPTLSGNQTAQNFSAVLLGELTGNWTPGGTSFAAQALTAETADPAQQASIALPTITAAPNTSITIPITVGNLTGQGVIAYDFDLVFDANVLQAQSTPVDATGTLSSALTVTANATPGRLRVSAFGTQALSGAGTLLNLKFNVIGAGNTALTWQRFLLNETAQTNLTNGRVNAVAAVASVSAASFLGPVLARESIVAAFGTNLATTTQLAATVPLPTTLAGTTVSVRDALGVARAAPLFFVSPAQINYLIPPDTAPGAAVVTITSGNGQSSLGAINIAPVAPGLFTADASGQGVAAAAALRIKTDGTQIFEPITQYDAATQRFIATPIDLGPEGEQVLLLLFGTGVRGRSALSAVNVRLGGVAGEVLYAGAQGGFVGLDQLNVRLPRALAGRGEVDVVLTVDGKLANTVRVSIK